MRVYDMKATCNKIFDLAAGQGMSLTCLAEKLNVTAQAVSKWHKASNSPSIDNLVLMSDLFDITLDELVQRREE